MRTGLKRLFVLSLAGIIGLSSVACGKSTASNEVVLKDVSFPLEKEASLSFLTSASSISTQNPNERVIFQRLEDETNVKIDWTCYVADQFNDKKNLALAKKDRLPDGLFTADMGTVDLLRYAKQGVIVPVEDLIDQYMPNLKKVLDENPSYRKLITAPDGHIYSFPWIEQLGVEKEAIQSIGAMPWINKKWLDELGLPVPKTTEELKQALIAFRDQKPEGTTDIIPMSFRVNQGNEDVGFLLGAFGYGDNSDHVMINEDNQVIYSAVQTGYKDGMNWLHSLQEEKLIDPEAYTQDWATYAAKGKNNRYGLFFSWDNLNVAGNPADYVPLPALEGPDGNVNAPRQSGSADGGFQAGRCVLTSACKNLELASKWLDLMYAPLQSIQNNWGTYGEENKPNVFEPIKDNFMKHAVITDASPNEVRENQMTGGPLAILNGYYDTYTDCPADALERMNIIKDVYVKDMKYDQVYPNVFMTEDDAQKVLQYETQIKQYVSQMKSEWILNGGADEQWDAYLQKLESLGLSDYLSIKQKYFDEYTK